ncbi:MAG TPA: hypothetical protein PK166_14565 [Candidatus Hydrogenedentes bacterium]|nr:hypothetical protein [Candidatus Hydrogenedentota bacterium]
MVPAVRFRADIRAARRVVFLAGLLIPGLALAAANPVVQKSSVRMQELDRHVEADLFQPDFLVGDSNYHALTVASDGNVHFVINTHNFDFGCRYYIFNPATEAITLVGKLDEVLQEPAATHVPQGKVHTPLVEHQGKLWFATHTSHYHGEFPEFDSKGKAPYSGGRFMNYDLQTGQFTDVARGVPGEGIITMAMDTQREVLYGLTWPSGILLTYDIAKQEMRCWGGVQGRGEWGEHPWEWDRVCRTLGVAPSGEVYGSTMYGRIWKFDPAAYNAVTYIHGLDLARLPVSQSAVETQRGDFQYNWRVIDWNPATKSFWGITWETTTLFEFDPAANYLRTVDEMRPGAYRGMPRNPEISQLGFMLGPGNTLFYLAHGPEVALDGRPAAQSGLYLLTYDIQREELTNHGPILSRDGRRVFFSESIAIGGQDEHIYTVAWVEVIDPARRDEIAKARAFGPAETAQMVYEILLVRLPPWQRFVRGN